MSWGVGGGVVVEGPFLPPGCNYLKEPGTPRMLTLGLLVLGLLMLG